MFSESSMESFNIFRLCLVSPLFFLFLIIKSFSKTLIKSNSIFWFDFFRIQLRQRPNRQFYSWSQILLKFFLNVFHFFLFTPSPPLPSYTKAFRFFFQHMLYLFIWLLKEKKSEMIARARNWILNWGRRNSREKKRTRTFSTTISLMAVN